MNKTIKKPNKKSLCYLGVVLIIAILVCVGIFYYFSRSKEIEEEKPPTEKSMEEIIKDLTAPEGVAEPVSEDVLKSLTAPK